MRDWTHVDDTCAALDCILHADLAPLRGEVINIGSGESISIADIAGMVVRVMGASPSLITYVGERPGQVFRHTADRSKAARLIGWAPRVTFEDGLRRTAEWYTKNREWWQKQLWMREIPIVTRSGDQDLH
jgi:dTDP-glucose 4,6-dehydratase